MIVPDESGLLPNEKPDEDKTVLTALTAKSILEDIQVVAYILDEEYISTIGYPEPGRSVNFTLEYKI